MKHASDIFPLALAELFKLAEQGKARKGQRGKVIALWVIVKRSAYRVNAQGKQNYNSTNTKRKIDNMETTEEKRRRRQRIFRCVQLWKCKEDA